MTAPPQRILSFDVGIKNLAYCFLVRSHEKTTIQDWRVLDLMDNGARTPGPVATCTCTTGIVKKRTSAAGSEPPKICGKTAKYTHVGTQELYCEVHAKSHATAGNAGNAGNVGNAGNGWLIPKRVYERSRLNTLKREQLEALVREFQVSVPLEPKPTKKIYVESLCAHFQRVCYQRIGELGNGMVQGGTPGGNSKQADLITLGRNMMRQLDAWAAHWPEPPTHVILENQISTVASRMKTIQGELTMYFLMRFPEAHIEYISSKNKLKGFEDGASVAGASASSSSPQTPNEKYKQHKRDAVTYTQQLLEAHPSMLYWKPYVMGSKKKDDLCDCFLQGMWYFTKQ